MTPTPRPPSPSPRTDRAETEAVVTEPKQLEKRECTTPGCRVFTYTARPPEFSFCPHCGVVGHEERP